MKILVVATLFPWPETTGARMRLANVVRGLSRLGEVDLFVMAHPNREGPYVVPADVRVARAEVVPRPAGGVSLLQRVRRLAPGRLPASVAGCAHPKIVARYRDWAGGRYDLVWFSRAESYAALGCCVQGPRIVDVDDLEDRKLEAALAAEDMVADAAPAEAGSRVRRHLRRIRDAGDSTRWRRFLIDIAGGVDAVAVCSDLDRRRLGAGNAAVVPNGYAVPARSLGRLPVGEPPTILFQGLLVYAPNVDAAHFLIGRIAPRLWARLPQARIRLVGDVDDRVRRLHAPPRVVVTGFVEDIAVELARADLIAVPIRFAGGTRIKILEAFAHRIPVVATTIGVEGIDATDERELLVRDSPEAFADACVRLLTDEQSRDRLVEAAHRLFLARYRSDAIQATIASLGRRVAASALEAGR